MAAKDIRFGEDARTKMVRGVNVLAERRQGHPRARRAATSSCRRASAPRPSPRTASPSAKEIELADALREHGRADGEGSCFPQTSDNAGDGTTTATVAGPGLDPRRA